MRDAAELEWAGIPTVAVVHETMAGSARAMARVSGMPDYEFAVVGYPYAPLARWTPDEVVDVARLVAPAVLRLLVAD